MGGQIINCNCGHSFPEALGKYGCPNCEGESMTAPKTTAERVQKHYAARKARKIAIEGDVLDRLAKYQADKGWSSRSEALRALVEKAGY